MPIFDLLIIGGGPAGYLAAERASASGMNVALIEERKLGGICLNEGCIPTKTLLHSAKLYDSIKSAAKYGIKAERVSIDHQEILLRKQRIVKLLVSNIESKMKKSNVTVIVGRGRIIGKNSDLYTVSANNCLYQAKKMIIAAGSIPIIPPIDGIKQAMESGFAVSTREILDLQVVPRKLAVLGGGVIGLEMASYFNSIGCQVTIFELQDHIAGNLDSQIGKVLEKAICKKGIDLLLSTKVTSINNQDITFEQNGKPQSRGFDLLLVSVGRKPCTMDLGLETIGVSTEKGRIITDEHMCTNVSGVYAAGDINGLSMLAHTAYREAEVAVNHLAGKRDVVRYNAIPSVIYTNPEVASAGDTEKSALENGHQVKSITVPMRQSGRYLAEVDEGDGICKVIIDLEQNRILGIHMIGSYVSEIIYGASLLIETELRIEDIKELVFPHPTISEVIREALYAL